MFEKYARYDGMNSIINTIDLILQFKKLKEVKAKTDEQTHSDGMLQSMVTDPEKYNIC